MDDLREGNAENRASERRVVQSLRRIALEMLIGFVGVYAAFALSAYKDQRDKIDRRHQIKRALIAEIKPIADLARSNEPGWRQFLAHFDSSVAAGHPAPRPFIETVSLTDHVWEATKQAGGLDLLDVPTFVALSAFYNQNSQELGQYTQLREFTIREVLPNVGGSPDAYFVPGTKTLRPTFAIYRYALRRLGNMDRSVAVSGDSLLVRLARDTI